MTTESNNETEHPPTSDIEFVKREIVRLQTEYYADRRWLFRSFIALIAVASIILSLLFGGTSQEIGTKTNCKSK